MADWRTNEPSARHDRLFRDLRPYANDSSPTSTVQQLKSLFGNGELLSVFRLPRGRYQAAIFRLC